MNKVLENFFCGNHSPQIFRPGASSHPWAAASLWAGSVDLKGGHGASLENWRFIQAALMFRVGCFSNTTGETPPSELWRLNGL